MPIKKCLILLFTMIFKIPETILTNSAGCQCNWKEASLRCDCSHRNLKLIPIDLKGMVKHLIISHNPLKILLRSAFKNYPYLEYFEFVTERPYSVSMEKDALIDLKNLQVFNITNVHYGQIELEFPKKLEVLVMRKTQLKDNHLNLKHLEMLKTVDLTDNQLIIVPEFHPTAPLVHINLRNNPLQTLLIDHLAKYCDLKTLEFSFRNSSLLNDYCFCTKIYEWVAKVGIVGLDPQDYSCIPDSKCKNFGITNQMVLDYNKCLMDSNRTSLLFTKVETTLTTRIIPNESNSNVSSYIFFFMLSVIGAVTLSAVVTLVLYGYSVAIGSQGFGIEEEEEVVESSHAM